MWFFDWLNSLTKNICVTFGIRSMMLLLIQYAYSIISILLWFPSNLNLDPDIIISQSSPSSAAAGWKVCLWAFASVYRLDQSPKNSEAESKKNTVSFRILPWYALIFDWHLLKFTVYHQFCMRCIQWIFVWKCFLFQDSAFSEDRLEGVWSTFLWWSFTVVETKWTMKTKTGCLGYKWTIIRVYMGL